MHVYSIIMRLNAFDNALWLNMTKFSIKKTVTSAMLQKENLPGHGVRLQDVTSYDSPVQFVPP